MKESGFGGGSGAISQRGTMGRGEREGEGGGSGKGRSSC